MFEESRDGDALRFSTDVPLPAVEFAAEPVSFTSPVEFDPDAPIFPVRHRRQVRSADPLLTALFWFPVTAFGLSCVFDRGVTCVLSLVIGFHWLIWALSQRNDERRQNTVQSANAEPAILDRPDLPRMAPTPPRKRWSIRCLMETMISVVLLPGLILMMLAACFRVMCPPTTIHVGPGPDDVIFVSYEQDPSPLIVLVCFLVAVFWKASEWHAARTAN